MKLLVLILLVLSLFVFACSHDVPVEKQCSVDADCVQASCCHANSAVNKENAPDCSDIYCTMECQENTLDCGQGEVKCVSGECQAVY